jgi:hypothetical protein
LLNGFSVTVTYIEKHVTQIRRMPMNKRQKKKLIPKDTDYCYKIVGYEENSGILHTERCPHYKIIGYVDDAIIDSNGKEHPCKSPVVYCSYTKVSSEEDVLLLDSVKICGERRRKIDFY